MPLSIKEAREHVIRTMDCYMCKFLGDEDLLEFWYSYGVPDEANDEDIDFIAENEAEFNRVCKLFGDLLNNESEVERE